MAAKETQKDTCNGKVLQGVVTSTKAKDTAVVAVNRYFKHARYGKFINTQKKYQVHDAGNTAKVGDKVTIEECRPVSKTKRFKLVSNA